MTSASSKAKSDLAFCQEELGWLLETIQTLAAIESPTDDKAAVDRCGHDLARRLRALGAQVTLLAQPTAGDHVRAELAGPADSSARILLLGHIDTVWPIGTLDRMPIGVRDGRLYGPGVFDMKAGVGLAMLAIRALQADGPLPSSIVFLCTSDEEVGSATSRTTIEAEARRATAVLVLEPALPDGSVKTARKGVGEFRLEVTGVSAHAGIDPSRGASAILELAHQIERVATLADPPRGTTVNVGVISGGTRSNVVAERASAAVDVRVTSMAEADRMTAAFQALHRRDPRTTVAARGGMNRPPLERSPAVVQLYEQAKEVARALGRPLGEGATGGASDGNFTAALGVPTLDGLGPTGEGAHALHEHVVVDDLPFRASLLAGLIRRLGLLESTDASVS